MDDERSVAVCLNGFVYAVRIASILAIAVKLARYIHFVSREIHFLDSEGDEVEECREHQDLFEYCCYRWRISRGKLGPFFSAYHSWPVFDGVRLDSD
jgi:hypothetical protein